MTEDIAIDLGTANTLIIHNDKVVIDSPSIVARDRISGKIIAVGKEANMMQGKTHENIKTIRPLKDGVIADFDASEKMISLFIKSIPALKKKMFTPALRMVVCIPSGITEVEMRAVKESCERVNGKEVYLIHEPMAAAIGIGIDIMQPKGNMIVDIGGGTTEIGVTSLGGLVLCKSVKVGGDKIDRSIIEYVRQNYNLFIGERTAETVKIAVAAAIKLDPELKIQIKGKDHSGYLSTIELGSEGIRIAIKEPLKEIASAIRSVLENMPPDLAGDVVDNGIIITGGGALIRGLDKYLTEIVKIPVRIADEPLLSVAYGTSQVLDEPGLLKIIEDMKNS